MPPNSLCLLGISLCLHACCLPGSSGAPALARDAAAAASCEAPRAPSSARRRFCYVPPTISPEAAAFLGSMQGVQPQPRLHGDAAAAARVQAAFAARTRPFSEQAAREHLQSVRNASIGGVRVWWATPKGCDAGKASGRLLVYLHGGAYIKGSCDSLWQVTALVAREAGVQLLCVDYRLAPQHPFPAGLDDAVAVYAHLVTHQGYAPRNIGVIGDSAGGGLSLALMQRLRARGLELPAALGLFAPWADLSDRGDTLTTLTGIDPTLQWELNLQPAALDYVAGDASKLSDPLVSPLLADYSALGKAFPPTLIQVGLRDSLLSTSVMLYRKLLDAGAAIVISPYEAMPHVFQASLQLPEARAAAKEMGRHFRRHLRV